MFVVKRGWGHKARVTRAFVVMGPRLRGDDSGVGLRVAATAASYASPSVSNIAALIASSADLPAHTTNWNAG
jgi:hypothetical protein